jgi:uncharacterized protein (TIGR02117 family)
MIIKKLKILFFLLFFSISLYTFTAFLLMLFPTSATKNSDQSTTSYISITHDLAHANIMLDLSRSSIAWHTLLPKLIPAKQGYLLIGWGDKDLYQSTPTWGDLKTSVALKALFINTSAVLHVYYFPTIDPRQTNITTLPINSTISQAIEHHILQTFQDSPPRLSSMGYTDADRFYSAKGKYNIFMTCNTWVGDLLRKSGVSISRWTPFSYNIIHSLPKKH